VRAENAGTEDITRAYTDLEIRLAVKEETVARLRALLSRAGKLSDIIEVERELGRAVTELEQMKGERRYYDSQVAMSTISASLFEARTAGMATFSDPVSAAVRRALEVLGASVSSLIYLLFFLAPWVVVASVAFWAARRRRRHRLAQS
jgi:hypothetical protein